MNRYYEGIIGVVLGLIFLIFGILTQPECSVSCNECYNSKAGVFHIVGIVIVLFSLIRVLMLIIREDVMKDE